MQLIIESPEQLANDELLQMIRDKATQLEHLYHRITRCVVSLKKVKSGHKEAFRIDTRVDFPGNILFVSKQADSISNALSAVIENLSRQVNKYKKAREETW